MESLEEVLSSERQEAAVLRKRGLTDRADDIERMCDRIVKAMPTHLKWLSESEAIAWSGKSGAWLRGRFAGWSLTSDAKKEGRHRYYRASALPRDVDVAALRRRAQLDAKVAA